MPSLDEVRRQITALSLQERRELAAWLCSVEPAERSPAERCSGVSGIDSDPRVCGGEARIVRTRIPVWTLEQMRRLGMQEVDILRSYPTLRAEDLVHAWAFADLHRDEMDQQIRENEEA